MQGNEAPWQCGLRQVSLAKLSFLREVRTGRLSPLSCCNGRRGCVETVGTVPSIEKVPGRVCRYDTASHTHYMPHALCSYTTYSYNLIS